MKLEAQPWTADFRTTAATDSFPSFLGSEGWVSLIDWLWRFLSLLGWVGMFLHVLSCRPPVLSGGAGLGTLAALLWPRTCFLSFGPGLGRFLRFFRPADPPRSVPGHGLGNRAAQLRHRTVRFMCSFLFRPAGPAPRDRGVLG